MKIVRPSTPTGNTIFCDDIRMEATGKITLIGTYSGEMFVSPDFPVTLPKICFRVTYLESPNESTEPVAFRIFFPGEEAPVIDATIPREQIEQTAVRPPSADSEPLIAMIAHIERPIATIKEAGLIRVRAYRGDTEIRLGSLRVSKAPQPPQTH